MVETQTASLSEKIKLFFKIIVLLILVVLGDLLITLIMGIIYKVVFPTIDINYIMTKYSYQVLLILFISIYHIILVFLFYKKTTVSVEKLSFLGILKCITLGALIGLTYNLLIGSPSSKNTTAIVLLNMGIIGPILEEFLFRGWIYQKLQLFFCKKVSKYISTCFFAFSHSNWTNILYAFLLGTALIESYDKSKNFKIPVLIHVGANTFVILFYSMLKPWRVLGSLIGLLSLLCFFLFQRNSKKLHS